MCNKACIDFGVKMLTQELIKEKRVLEIGSYDVNGSLSDYLKQFNPTSYIGVDMVPGKGVDVVCKAEDLLGIYGPGSFDVIISTEMMEHIWDWKKVINNIKTMCAFGGCILITTRSFGFEHHGWPHDHWRFETYDMRYIFSDFKEHGTIIVEKDPDKGVLLFVRKPISNRDYRMLNIEDYRLYNIVYDLRV